MLKFLLVESGILGLEIQNEIQQWESGIQVPLKKIWNPVIGIIITIIMIVYSTFLQHKLNYKAGH